MKIDRNNKLNLQNVQNINKNNYHLMNSNIINSSSNRRYLDHYQKINKF